jgi:hypothetical protein
MPPLLPRASPHSRRSARGLDMRLRPTMEGGSRRLAQAAAMTDSWYVPMPRRLLSFTSRLGLRRANPIGRRIIWDPVLPHPIGADTAFKQAACFQRLLRELDVLQAQVGKGRRRRGLEARVRSVQSAVFDPTIVGEVKPIVAVRPRGAGKPCRLAS